MTRFNTRIKKENALDIIKLFAKEYRKELGKIPGEIIIVGGGSIMLNYKFRDSTQDFDVILKTASSVKDVIGTFADKYNLPRDWMNSDFIKTSSYSGALSEVSRHLITLNNGTLEVRTVAGVYLIAMKLRAHRDYRNDISDTIGIIVEERENGNNICFDDIKNAYKKLYSETMPRDLYNKMKKFCSMTSEELKELYIRQNFVEQDTKNKLITYASEGVEINAKNIDDVIAAIKKKMK